MREARPFVILKAATSLDGCIAAAPATRTQSDVGRGQPARARVPRGGRRDRRRRRDDSRRRSAADRAGGLPRAAADARGVRSAAAHARRARAALDTRGRACHHRDDAPAAAPAAGVRQRSKRAARRSTSPPTTRSAPRSSGWARGRSGRCCSKAAPRCTRRRGTKGSSISCGSTSRRTRSAAAACRFSTDRSFRDGDAARAARRSARAGRLDRGICSPASIEAIGALVERQTTSGGVRAADRVAAGRRVGAGDSLAVNGVCLTAIVGRSRRRSTRTSGPRPMRVTTLGTLALGQRVNLERPLRADGRFGGHFVQGHVDGDRLRRGLRRPRPSSSGSRSAFRRRSRRTSCARGRSPSTASA